MSYIPIWAELDGFEFVQVSNLKSKVKALKTLLLSPIKTLLLSVEFDGFDFVQASTLK
jgi:hypothetical protein